MTVGTLPLAVKYLPTVIEINLRNRKIDDTGIEALAIAVKQKEQLTRLNLKSGVGSISERGLRILFGAIGESRSLLEFSSSYMLRDVGALKLAHAIRRSDS